MRDARKEGGRRSLDQIVRGYDRVARLYARFEPLFLIFPRARRKAVAALDLAPGMTVLEIGAGTGRNLPYLVDAVGPAGRVIAVDASPGMLAEARKLIAERGWANVQLLQQDAARLDVDAELDGVLFSLSYSVLPDPLSALSRAWERLRVGRRLVVMDLGLTYSRAQRLLAPTRDSSKSSAPGMRFRNPGTTSPPTAKWRRSSSSPTSITSARSKRNLRRSAKSLGSPRKGGTGVEHGRVRHFSNWSVKECPSITDCPSSSPFSSLPSFSPLPRPAPRTY